MSVAARIIETPAIEEDVDFCRVILPGVSRTFALSISALPDSLHDAVLVAYLLCRIVDTIEDEPELDSGDRSELFNLFGAAMVDDRRATESFVARVEELQLAAGIADGELCRGAGAVFRLFRALPDLQRREIRPRVLEMSSGMRAYCMRNHEEGALRLRDLEDLEQYCYYVAGTVGKLLTSLFLQLVPDLDPISRSEIAETAVSFGVGLQMVNVIKDVGPDLERDACFMPTELARAHGIELEQLLDPAHRDAGLKVVREVCERARQHLERAKTYTLQWPVPEGRAIRLFCAVPLALALATIAEVENGSHTLSVDGVPKVSRQLVARVLEEIHEAVDNDAALGAMLDRITQLH